MKTNHLQLQTDMTISSSIVEELMAYKKQHGIVHSVFDNGFNLKINQQLIYVSTLDQSLTAHGMLWSTQSFTQVKPFLKPGLRVQYTQGLHTNPAEQNLQYQQALQQKQVRWRFYTHPLTIDVHATVETVLNLSLQSKELETADFQRFIFALSKAQLKENCDPYLFKMDPIISRLDQKNPNLMSPSWLYQWIGAGHGLTPSGDDFLQGMLMGATLLGDNRLKLVISDVLKTRSTTDVAHAYYQNIFRNEANLDWHLLIDAILLNNEIAINSAIKKIQSHGASSGNDILFGLYYYLLQIFNQEVTQWRNELLLH